MKKREYLDLLGGQLSGLPYGDVKEIVDEIDAHFESGMAAGKTEDEISDGLGSPIELAKAYLDDEPQKLPAVLRKEEVKGPSKGARVFVVLFSIFVGAPITLCWSALDCWLVECAVKGLIFSLVNFFAIGSFGSYVLSGVLFELMVFFGSIFFACAAYFGIKYIYVCGKKFFKWNKKLWTRGF